MPSRFLQSLRKLTLRRQRTNAEEDSQSRESPPRPPPRTPRPRVRVGVRKNPDLVGVEKETQARKQAEAINLLTMLRDMERENLRGLRGLEGLTEYTTVQFVKTILMRVSEGSPVTSCWVQQVEEHICQSQREKEALHEAVQWVRAVMQK
ncbi:C protein [Nariva virus]|uniref:C protein n=1 Tax=Nariva virus TaxID=590647 RepID=B8XH61_9MONO|nr:C protein [Nariva virus]ACL97356.1 C protein [Nariva virus]